MGLQAKVGSFNTGTAAAGNDIVVTGVGFQPKALFFFWDGSIDGTVDTVAGATAQPSFAYTDGVDQFRESTFITDGSASSDSSVSMVDSNFVHRKSAVTTGNGDATFVSFDPDGFTLDIVAAFGISVRVHYLALGGDGFEANMGVGNIGSTLGADVYTGVGFKPSALLFAMSNLTTFPNSGNGANMCLGVCGTDLSQANFSGAVRDAQAASDSYSRASEGDACLQPSSGGSASVFAASAVQSLDADGFTMNITNGGGSAPFSYLAMKNVKAKVGSFLTRTDGNNIQVTGLGFTPQAILFVSHGKTEDATEAVSNDFRLSLGAASGPAARAAIGAYDQDAAATMNVARGIEHDAVYMNIDSASAVVGLMDVVSFDTDGFTCVMDDPDPVASFVWYIALGSITVEYATVDNSISGSAAVIRRIVGFATVANSVSGSSVALGRLRGLEGLSTAISGHTASFGSITRFEGQLSAVSGSSADLLIPGKIDFVGEIASESGSSAVLGISYVIAGVAHAVSSHQANLSVNINLQGLVASVSGSAANFTIEGGVSLSLEAIKPANIELEALV